MAKRDRNAKTTWRRCAWRPHWSEEQAKAAATPPGARASAVYHVESIKNALRFVARDRDPQTGIELVDEHRRTMATLAEAALAIIVRLQTEKHEALMQLHGGSLEVAEKLLKRTEKIEVPK